MHQAAGKVEVKVNEEEDERLREAVKSNLVYNALRLQLERGKVVVKVVKEEEEGDWIEDASIKSNFLPQALWTLLAA